MTPAPSKKLPWRYAAIPGLFLLLVFWLSAYQANIEALFRDSSIHLLLASAQHVHRGFAVAFWLGWAWLINGLVALFVWEGVARHLVTGSVPRFFRNTVSILIFMVAFAGILSLVFGLDLTGLWATSGVLGLVLGFALKSLIADFFSGVALSLDPPFKIGDWIQVALPGEGTLYGQVVEMHWRQTKIQSRGRTRTVSVPHSLLTSASVHQLYQPAGRLRFDWSVSLNQTLGVDRAIRILEAAVYSAPMILQDPRPQVLMTGSDSSGLTYNIRYWIKPDISMEKARHAVVHSVFTTMERANVLLACIKFDVFNAAQVPDVWDPEGGKSTFITLTSVFSTLEDEEVQELASRTTIREVQAGETVVAAGQPGDSMYIIREGTLDVLLHADGEHSKVAHLRSGDFFGEMSLLTGEPRSATVKAVSHAVLYEIGKDALQPVLTRNSHVAERICDVVASRQSENVDHLDTRAAAAAAGAGSGFGTQLLAKVRKFFAL